MSDAASTIALTALALTVWAAAPAALLRRAPPRLGALLDPVILWAAFGVALAAPGFRGAAVAGYPNDSLFTLAPHAQAATASIALLLSAVAILLARRFFSAARRRIRRRGAAERALTGAVTIIGALGALTAGYVLAPQIFYAYYRTEIAGMPAQWVVDPAHALSRLGEAILLVPDGSLAGHGAGLLFWTLFGVGVFDLIARPRADA